jgi:hypothetical protein
MPGLGPGIHAFPTVQPKTWMAGPSPAMTIREPIALQRARSVR